MNISKINFLKKIPLFLLLILVIFIPWHAFLITFISSFFGSTSEFLPKISMFLSSWKEIIILFLGISFVGKWIFYKKFPIKKFYIFDYIFFIFLAIALFSWLFLTKNFIQGFWGFRLDFIYFALFYILRGFSFEKNEINKLIKYFIFSGTLSLVFGLLFYSTSFNRVPNKIDAKAQNYQNLTQEKKEFLDIFYKKYIIKNTNYTLILEKEKTKELKAFFEHHEQINFRNENFLNLMTKFGYSSNISSYNPNKPLPAFHFVEARGTARFSGTSSGPNQMGFFIIIFLGLLFSIFYNYLKKEINLSKVQFYFIIFSIILAFLGLYFSFSRSAWLGFIGIFGLFILFSIPKKYRFYTFILGLFSGIIVLFSIYFFANDFWKRVLVREGSSSVHFQKMEEGILQVLQNPLGLGLGKAGPVTIRFSERNMQNISENWFIQMFQEFGIFGGIIYLLFLVFFLSFLIKNYSKNYLIYGGFLGISGILIAGIFLHSFEDIGVSLLLFLILGIGVKNISQN